MSVIIPIFNEQDTCQELIDRVMRAPLETEVIVVDDGSTDDSGEILAQIEGIRLVRHERNQGKGAAVISSLDHITGDFVVLQDGDLEYDPADYPRLLEPLLKGKADVVLGSRWLNKSNKLTTHYIGNRVLTFVSNMINQRELTDMASCYKMMPSDLFRSLGLRSQGFGIDAEITAKLFKRGYRILEVPISYRRRRIKEGKKIRWWDAATALWSCVRFSLWD